MDLQKPHQRLTAARIAAGFKTAKHFTDTYDIKYVNYTNHESGRRSLKMTHAYPYAHHLKNHLPKISADWLVWGGPDIPFDIDDETDEPKGNVLREEITPFQGFEDADISAEPLVELLCPDREHAYACTVHSKAMDLHGIFPGDTVIADLGRKPADGDTVIAQVYDFHAGRAETVIRLFEPPYLVARSSDPRYSPPVRADDAGAAIKSVVTYVIRKS